MEVYQAALDIDIQDENDVQRQIYWGKCRPYLFDKNNYPTVVIGPHWPLFMGAFLAFVAISLVMIKFTIDHKMHMITSFFIALVSFIQLASFLIVALRNPGIANIQENLPSDAQISRFKQIGRVWHCDTCNINQSPRTVHCNECKICILDMDHHCPWTGKCIGKGNIREFYGFIICSFIFMFCNLMITFTEAASNIK